MSFAVRAASWGSGVVVAGVWVLEGLLNALLATVRPRDPAGSTRRRMAAEELADIGRLDAKLKAMKAGLKAAVAASESHLMDIHGIGPAGAARILADVGDVARFPTAPTSPPGLAPPRSTPPAASTPTTACPGPGTAGSTTCSTWPASSSSATTPRAAPTTGAGSPKGRPPWKRCAACGGACPTWSTASWSPTRDHPSKRTREGTPGRLCHPARPAFPRTPALRISHFPDPHPRPYPRHQQHPRPPRPRRAPRPRRRARGVNLERPTGRTTLTPASAGASSKRPGPDS